MNIVAFVGFSLEVSLALLTSHEVLSVISYDLSHLATKPQGLGFSIVLMIGFEALEFGVFKVRSTFLR
jgi:hypothetical protein